MQESPHGMPVVQCRQHGSPPPGENVNVGCGTGVLVRCGVATGVSVGSGCEMQTHPISTGAHRAPAEHVPAHCGAVDCVQPSVALGGTKNDEATETSPRSVHCAGEHGNASQPSPPLQSRVTVAMSENAAGPAMNGSTIAQ